MAADTHGYNDGEPATPQQELVLSTPEDHPYYDSAFDPRSPTDGLPAVVLRPPTHGPNYDSAFDSSSDTGGLSAVDAPTSSRRYSRRGLLKLTGVGTVALAAGVTVGFFDRYRTYFGTMLGAIFSRSETNPLEGFANGTTHETLATRRSSPTRTSSSQATPKAKQTPGTRATRPNQPPTPTPEPTATAQPAPTATPTAPPTPTATPGPSIRHSPRASARRQRLFRSERHRHDRANR